MKKPATRSTQMGFFTCVLLAASLALTGCAHWQNTDHSALNGTPTRVSDTNGNMARFLNSVRISQGDAVYYYELGRYLQTKGRHALALQEFARAIELDSQRADAYNAMGISHDNLSQFDLAEQCYRWALILKPDFASAHNNLGYSLLIQDKPEQALAHLRNAVSLNSGNALFHNNLALAQRYTDKFAGVSRKSRDGRENGDAEAVFGTVSNPGSARPSADHRNADLGGDQELIQMSGNTLLSPTPRPSAGRSQTPGVDTPLLEKKKIGQSSPLPNFGQAQPVWVAPRIEIVNGNGAHRMARNLGSYFKTKGYDIQRLANADHFRHLRTRIYYSEGQRRAASDLARTLFGTEMGCDMVPNDRQDGHITVLVGNDAASLNDLFNGRLSIAVVNGNGVKGLARKLSLHFQEKGFHTVAPRDADHFGYHRTQILYPQGGLPNARLLAREFPKNCSGFLVQSMANKPTMQVVLGKDFVF